MTEIESIDRVVAASDESRDVEIGETLLDCPDCPAIYQTTGDIYGPYLCGECWAHQRGEMTFDELGVAKE